MIQESIVAITLPDTRQLADEVLEALRLRALHACELGFTQADVADILGVAPETVCRWWVAYSSGGLDAIPHERTGRPQGSGAALTDEQADRVQQIIDTRSPEDLGIASPLWNRRAVGELIRKECDVVLAVRTVGKYLQRWGYTAKKPTRHAGRQDPEEVRRWLEKTYPAIRTRAREEHAEIRWCDETGIVADQCSEYGYARRGQRATLEVPDPHIRINMASSISNEGTLRFMTYPGTMTGELFVVFLGRLLRGTTGKVFLIVDRLKAHQSAVVTEWLSRHRERIEVFELPRRAPERNPDEYLNNDVKREVKSEGLPDSKPALRSRLQHVMQKLVNLPKHVVGYFLHPCVLYAANAMA
jgi:transposase